MQLECWIATHSHTDENIDLSLSSGGWHQSILDIIIHLFKTTMLRQQQKTSGEISAH